METETQYGNMRVTPHLSGRASGSTGTEMAEPTTTLSSFKADDWEKLESTSKFQTLTPPVTGYKCNAKFANEETINTMWLFEKTRRMT